MNIVAINFGVNVSVEANTSKQSTARIFYKDSHQWLETMQKTQIPTEQK